MRQRARAGRRAQAGLNPAPWLHGPHGRSGQPPSPRDACLLAPRKPSSLWESPGRLLRHTQDLLMVGVHSLASPELPFKCWWVCPWRAARPPKDRGNAGWKAAGGGHGGGQAGPCGQQSLPTGFPARVLSAAPSFSQPTPCRPGAQLCWGIYRRGGMKLGAGAGTEPRRGREAGGSPFSHLESVELRRSVSEPRRWTGSQVRRRPGSGPGASPGPALAGLRGP